MLHDGISQRVAIVGGSRIPFCRSHSVYRGISNQQLMTAALKGVVDKFDLRGQTLGDVALGAVIKHSRDFNLARESVIDSGLSMNTPGVDLQRACGTSLEAAIMVGNKIALGQIESGIAGGTDTISDAPIVLKDKFRHMLLDMSTARSLGGRLAALAKFRPGMLAPDFPSVLEPRTQLSMGESTELTAKEWGIERQHQDHIAYLSHLKAAAAYDEGWYDELVVPFMDCEEDNNIRRDTTPEKLAKLKPVFDRSSEGTMTAGNSTPLTDGAAAVLLANEDWARKKNLPILAYLTFARVAAVDFVNKEGLLLAPAYAVSDMLKQADLTLQDFDFYEIHEAFAAQTLATMKAWQDDAFCRERLGRNEPMGSIDMERLNVKGGSIAMGHPFAATGARILGTLSKLLHENGGGRGLISVCTAGGMGVTAILEAP
ncbi:MAG: acetyl-CoA C-acetyltransferase [Pseudomonadota bacterium]